MYKLSRENFKVIEKFVITKGENYNQDRCIEIPINKRTLVCYLDEIDSEIRICQVDKENVTFKNSPGYVSEIIDLANEASYSVVEECKYVGYIEVIKLETECCDKDCRRCREMLED